MNALRIFIRTHDFAFRIDRIDFGPQRVRHVNRRVDTLAPHETMARVIGGDVETNDRTGVIDALRHGHAALRAGRVDRGEDAFVQQEPVDTLVFIPVGSNDLSPVIDPDGLGSARSRAGRVDLREDAFAPDETVAGVFGIRREPHDLAVRVDEEGRREGRIGRVERGKDVLTPEVAVHTAIREIQSYPVPLGVGPVDAGISVGVGRVDLREDALA